MGRLRFLIVCSLLAWSAPAVAGEWLLANGEPVLVKGVSYSPYRPGQSPGRAQVPLALIERDFQRIATMGFNAICPAAPLTDEALELAARHGLMVLQPDDPAIAHHVVFAYQPANVSHIFGFRNYLELLRRAHTDTPLIISTGLSKSPIAGPQYGYGGLDSMTRREWLLRIWDDVFQSGAQGAVLVEWADAWWKSGATPDDASNHDPADPEEWFGLIEFEGADQPEGRPREDVHEPLTAYNQAVLLQPVSGVWHERQLPVRVYATDRVASIRVQLSSGGWTPLTRVSPHWWEATLPAPAVLPPGDHPLTMEAFDAGQRRLTRFERLIAVGPPLPTVQVTLTTDRAEYEAGPAAEPIRYTVTVTDPGGRPIPYWPVDWSVIESASGRETQGRTATNARGQFTGTHTIGSPGGVLVSAAAPADVETSARKIGSEILITAR